MRNGALDKPAASEQSQPRVQDAASTRSAAKDCSFVYTADSLASGTLAVPLADTMQAGGEIDRLLVAIDNLAYAEPVQSFAGRFILSGEIALGGQGVIAFARDNSAGMRQYAIKCALHASACARF